MRFPSLNANRIGLMEMRPLACSWRRQSIQSNVPFIFIELQYPHAGALLSNSSDPPNDFGWIWSMVVAFSPQ
jgi:hypothetical protein